MIRFLISGLFMFALISCENSDHYKVNCCEGTQSVDYNGIIYLAESANLVSRQRLQDTASLKQYLSQDEMKHAFDTFSEAGTFETTYKTECFPMDTLFVSKNFTAEVIFLKDNTDSRGYYYQIRTFDNNRKLVSIQEFATWADKTRKYCSGDFDKQNQTFSVICDKTKAEYKFDERGNILLIDKNSY